MPGLGMMQTWSPRVLFPATGAGGCWYDPSDLGTMFQDTAGTVPCAVDSRVALLKDKGPFGYDVSQATTANQPYLRKESGTNRHYLEFTGTQFLKSGDVVPYNSGRMMTVFAAQIINLPSSSSVFLFFNRGSQYDNQSQQPSITVTQSSNQERFSYPYQAGVIQSPISYNKLIRSATVDYAANDFKLYLNGVLYGNANRYFSDGGTLKPVQIGSNATFNFYGCQVIFGFDYTLANLKRAEKWMSDRMALVY